MLHASVVDFTQFRSGFVTNAANIVFWYILFFRSCQTSKKNTYETRWKTFFCVRKTGSRRKVQLKLFKSVNTHFFHSSLYIATQTYFGVCATVVSLTFITHMLSDDDIKCNLVWYSVDDNVARTKNTHIYGLSNNNFLMHIHICKDRTRLACSMGIAAKMWMTRWKSVVWRRTNISHVFFLLLFFY